MGRVITVPLILFCFIMLMAKPGWAQSPSPEDLKSIQRQRNQLILQEEERRRRERLQLHEQKAPESLMAPQLDFEAAAEEGGPCFIFKEIRLEGVTLLTEAEQEELIENDVGSCLYLSDINRLMGSITNVYIKKGYVLARAYLQPQNLSDGLLEIVIFEGELEDIDIFQNGERRRSEFENVFPGLKGEVLNIRDLEQGLDQINRLRFHEGTITMEPGTETGEGPCSR